MVTLWIYDDLHWFDHSCQSMWRVVANQSKPKHQYMCEKVKIIRISFSVSRLYQNYDSTILKMPRPLLVHACRASTFMQRAVFFTRHRNVSFHFLVAFNRTACFIIDYANQYSLKPFFINHNFCATVNCGMFSVIPTEKYLFILNIFMNT